MTNSRGRTPALTRLCELPLIGESSLVLGEHALDSSPPLSLDQDESDFTTLRVADDLAVLTEFELERLVEYEVPLRVDADKGAEEQA